MKDKIHPKYQEATVTCTCGNVIETRSTRPKISVQICSNCHPFFTGKQKFIDTAGRVEKFQRRYGWTEERVQQQAQKGKKGSPAAPSPSPAPEGSTVEKSTTKDAASDDTKQEAS